MEEIFEPIKNYDGKYEISNTGLVKRLKRRKNGGQLIKEYILKTRINNCGYKEVRLFNGKSKTTFVHILIAQAFIPNPSNKCCVNHEDGNKRNNNISNLSWVSHSENMQHAWTTGLINKAKSVIDKCTGQIFKSARIASEHYKIKHNTLRGYLNGQINNPTCLEYQ
jgi:NUMOD4 motif/HNH endonuclease